MLAHAARKKMGGGGGVWHFPTAADDIESVKSDAWPQRISLSALDILPTALLQIQKEESARQPTTRTVDETEETLLFYSFYLGRGQSPSHSTAKFFPFHEDEYVASE